MMKSKVCVVLLFMTLTCVNAWATWDPNTDPNLTFNLNFEDNDIPAMLTYAVKPPGSVTGTIDDYNTVDWADHNQFFVPGIRRTSANLHYGNDYLPFGSYPNDVVVKFNGAGAYELGTSSKKHTWALWFNDTDYNMPGEPFDTVNYPDTNRPISLDPNTPGYVAQDVLEESSFIRYLLTYSETTEYYKNWWWEFRIHSGRFQFREGRGHITVDSAQSLADLGVEPGEWHHVAVVIDRSARDNSKIYLDGLEIPTDIAAFNDSVDSTFDASSNYTRMRIGTGDYDNDGLIDEVRHYSKALTAEQICILSQWNPDDPNPMALDPAPAETDIAMATSLNWAPSGDAGLTQQRVYFGTTSGSLTLVPGGTVGPAVTTISNGQLNGGKPLVPLTTYYWRVDSTISGTPYTGHEWSFVVETGKAGNPDPYNGEQDVNNIGTTDISWTTSTTSSRNFDVYFGTDETLVTARNAATQIGYAQTATSISSVATPILGKTYYWVVDTNYTTITTYVDGDVWNFRTEPYKLIFNTDDNDVDYGGHTIPGYECHLKVAGGDWDDVNNPIATGTPVAGVVTVFDFSSDLVVPSTTDIVVVPDYYAGATADSDNDLAALPMSLGIHVTGNVTIDGALDISGD
ncbi:MAG: LamG domain-containing protein, partial [Sedimentisphaerales bacterium]|nr:LamG domain-containing protein [Sedimentisphaerales bacterium]